MANEENLKKFGSEREPRESGRNGGIASGEARRKKRTMKQAAKALLSMSVSSEESIKIMKALGIAEEDLTNQMAVMVAMLVKATKGDVKAATFLRDTIGESPSTEMHKADMKLRRDEMAIRMGTGGGGLSNNLLDAIIAGTSEEIDCNEIPELVEKAEHSDDLVEQAGSE